MADVNTVTPEPTPEPAAEPTPAQREFLDSLSGGSTNQPTEPAAEPSEPPATEPEGDPKPDPEPAPKPNEVLGNAPFAQLRVQNKALQDALQRIAPTLGVDITKIDAKNPEALQRAVMEAAVKKEAEAQQQDPVLMAKLYNAEQALLDQQRQTNEILARQGFAQVQQTFSLDQNALETFAGDLVAKGINPYESPMDLVAVYKMLNMDSIIEAQVNEKVAAQLKQREHSTSPNPTTGGAAVPNNVPINTVAALDAFLKTK